MNRVFYLLVIATITIVLLPACATIIGGNNYNALVTVENHPDAKIYCQNTTVGKGSALVTLNRKNANKLVFKVSKEGCKTEEYNFDTRKVRWATIVGSLPFYYPIPLGIPIPFGNLIDLATGAIYKPDESDLRIVKGDFNNYYYKLVYECDIPDVNNPTYAPSSIPTETEGIPVTKALSKEEKLLELKDLFDKGLITEEEYKKARQDILSK